MLIINFEINLNLTWPLNCIISNSTNKATTFAKDYVPVVTLSTQDNAKLLEQLKSGFKRKINWKKYKSKVTIQVQNQYLDYLIDSSFQGVKCPFVL